MAMKIGIVGWGVEGQSAYRFFGADHEYLIVNEHPRDDFPEQSERVKVQHLTADRPPGMTSNAADLSYLEGIDGCDKVIYSVTSRKNLEKAYGDNTDFWRKAVTTQHIFFETVKTKNIIGVTGTKGKGTTSTLIAKILEASGKNVHLGGNIGKSVLDFVRDVKPDDWVVLELSNFQLYKFPYSPHIAVCLMVVPEHLDWHVDVDEYTKAKTNLFAHQAKQDIAIYFAGNKYSEQIADYSEGVKIPYYQKPGALVRDDGMIVVGEPEVEVAKKTEVKLLGEHNLQNVCAAITATWQVVQDIAPINKVLNTFSGLEHRLEFVRELNGVKYYNDSFGTTPETAIVAMEAFEQPKVLILGGADKGVSLDNLADEVVRNKVRHVITLGQTGPKIARLLKQRGVEDVTEGLSDMPDIVDCARKASRPRDVVLLSTGSSSLDMFESYKVRGAQFKQAVLALS